jgi:hypothetical protein
MRTLTLLVLTIPVLACSDAAAPEPAAVDIVVTSVNLQVTGQWLVEFSITNNRTTTVYLPQCSGVMTELEGWTGSEWMRVPVEACLTIHDQSRYALTAGSSVEGDRVLPPSGRYRLRVRYTPEAGAALDQVAVTDPINIP